MSSTFTDLGSVLNPAANVQPTAGWGDQIRTNQDAIHKPPTVTLSNTTSLNCNGGSWFSQTFDVATIDSDSMHSTASNTERITVNQEGLYLFGGYGKWTDTDTTGARGLRFRKGGVTVLEDTLSNSLTGALSVRHNLSTIEHLTTGQYVECQAYWSGTSTNSINVTVDCVRVSGSTG